MLRRGHWMYSCIFQHSTPLWFYLYLFFTFKVEFKLFNVSVFFFLILSIAPLQSCGWLTSLKLCLQFIISSLELFLFFDRVNRCLADSRQHAVRSCWDSGEIQVVWDTVILFAFTITAGVIHWYIYIYIYIYITHLFRFMSDTKQKTVLLDRMASNLVNSSAHLTYSPTCFVVAVSFKCQARPLFLFCSPCLFSC